MYCPNCGAEINNNQKFCELCGNELTITSETPKEDEKANVNPTRFRRRCC
ncbi:MAG: zinc-ribbon domain-containing protein [Promethearchaeota archaeon]